MLDKLEKTIKEELVKLPKEAQDAINSLDWVKITEEIGKKYSLSDIEINNLQVETLLILNGTQDLAEYARNVENEVVTTTEEAKKISEEVNEKIFTPIMNTAMENIKKSGKDKNAKWDQNVNFILSGGDYTVFAEDRKATPAPTAVPVKPKMADIKSKFTI